jgi:hypothetical protein
MFFRSKQQKSAANFGTRLQYFLRLTLEVKFSASQQQVTDSSNEWLASLADSMMAL